MVKHAGTKVTHTFELEDREAHLLAGYMYEVLGLVETRTDNGVRMSAVAERFTRELFTAVNVDFLTYTGTSDLQQVP
jgi:hypothetical protein